MRKTWLLLGVGILMAVLAIATIACNDDDEEGPATPTATVAEPGETPTATEQAGVEATTPPAPTVVVSDHAELGSILTDADGSTLYTFTEDEPNVSNCQNDPCPQTWPPLIIGSEPPVAGEGIPGELGVIERQDGSRQVTYNDMPLYGFLNDQAPGDANGQGIGGRWFVVQIE